MRISLQSSFQRGLRYTARSVLVVTSKERLNYIRVIPETEEDVGSDPCRRDYGHRLLMFNLVNPSIIPYCIYHILGICYDSCYCYAHMVVNHVELLPLSMSYVVTHSDPCISSKDYRILAYYT